MDYDNQFLKQYKALLLKVNDLKDCAFDGGTDRFSNFELAEFRNRPKEPYVERDRDGRKPLRLYRNAYSPTYDDLFNHLVKQTTSTMWMANTLEEHLLMKVDIDLKEGSGDVDAAARYLSATYLFNRTFVEHSTGGRGRHAYFLLHAGNRREVVDVVARFSDVIHADKKFRDRGVSFDKVVYGSPTLWTRRHGEWAVERRGTLVKLPYLVRGQADLDEIRRLRWVELDELKTMAAAAGTTAGETSTTTKTILRRTTTRPTAAADAFEKKKACIDQQLRRSEGTCTLDEVIADYEANYSPSYRPEENVATAKAERRKKLAKMLEHRRDSFRRSIGHPHSFKRGRYLDLVRRIVPASEFVWKRREKIDHGRLADFVGIKVQDAFRPNGNWFAMQRRDATINNSKSMKANGLIDWSLTSNTYTKLLGIATAYRLLEVYEEYQKPTRSAKTRQVAFSGRPRLIGPGSALVTEKAEWMPLYERYKAQRDEAARRWLAA